MMDEMDGEMQEARRQVLRRVRYATNTLALLETRLPPEGPFDAALTNGLVSIVATEWPGDERKGDFVLSARKLLEMIRDRREPSTSFVAVESLAEGLDLTQPFRHGRAEDEFATINRTHIAALQALDRHRSLRLLDKARGKSVDEVVIIAYQEHAETHLPFSPKDRLEVPEPEECPECWRPTFLPQAWDAFGGTSSPGQCIACGYERSEDEAYDDAVDEAIRRRIDED